MNYEILHLTTADERFWELTNPVFNNSDMVATIRSESDGTIAMAPNKTWWVAFTPDDKVLGWVAARQLRGYVQGESHYVMAESRRQGVFTALVAARTRHHADQRQVAYVADDARNPHYRSGFVHGGEDGFGRFGHHWTKVVRDADPEPQPPYIF